MSTLYLRKIFPYDPTHNGTYSRYNGYVKIAKGIFDPSISNTVSIGGVSTVDGVYSSSLKRGVQTGKSLADKFNKPLVVMKQLNEVLFDLESLVTTKEFESLGSELVRKRFVQAFIADMLLERRLVIVERIRSVLTELTKRSGKNDYLVISHSFLMKLVEAYMIVGDELINKPSVIIGYFDYNKKTYEFGNGFDIKL